MRRRETAGGVVPPTQRSSKVHVVFDLRWNDSMVVSFVQRHRCQSVRVIDAHQRTATGRWTVTRRNQDRKYRIGACSCRALGIQGLQDRQRAPRKSSSATASGSGRAE